MIEWLFTAEYAGCFAVCLYLSKEHRAPDVLSPGVIFPVLLFFYSIASALFVEETGYTNFGYPVNEGILRSFNTCVLIGLLGFFVGRGLSVQCPVWRRKAMSTQDCCSLDFSNKLMFYAGLFAILCAPFILNSFNVWSQRSYAERALEMRVENMADAVSGVKTVVLVVVPVTIMLCACCSCVFDRKRGFLSRFAASIVICLNLGANLLAGWRGSVMATLGIVAIYYHYRVRRFRLPLLVGSSILAYALTSVMSLIRVTSNPTEMIGTLSHEINVNSLAFLGLSKSGELLTATNLMRQIGGIRDGELKYSFGRTILDDLLVMIPRPIYPNRPLPSGEEFVDVFYPGVRETGGGYGFFILQEGHWNGGYCGVFVVMCLFGYAVYSIYWLFLANMDSPYVLFSYILAYPALCVFSVRSGVVGSFKTAMVDVLPIVLLLLLPSVRKSNRNGKADPALVGRSRPVPRTDA